MAALSLAFSSDLQAHHKHLHAHGSPYIQSSFLNSHFASPIFKYSFPRIFPKSTHFNLFLTCSSTHSSSPSSTLQQNPLRPGKFLSNLDLQKLQFLESFKLFHKLPSGSMLLIRAMRESEMDMTVELLAESFAESMLLPKFYVNFLAFLVKQYLTERRVLMPHAVTLIGFHRRDTDEEKGEEEDIQLAGTVEISFDNLGVDASLPSPTPPKNSPYISNMTVKKSLRRQGIGSLLLKASEELISKLSPVREVYLHCRMIDSAPFNMYSKAGYEVVKTDSFLILLILQRRKHLLRKHLPPASYSHSETDLLNCEEKYPASSDT